jgi:hypothetical protein
VRDAGSNVDFEPKHLLSVYRQWLDMIPFIKEKIRPNVPKNAVFIIHYDELRIHYRGDTFRAYRHEGMVRFEDMAQLRLADILPEFNEIAGISYNIDGWRDDAGRLEDITYALSLMVPDAVKHADQWWAAHWAVNELNDLGNGSNK